MLMSASLAPTDTETVWLRLPISIAKHVLLETLRFNVDFIDAGLNAFKSKLAIIVRRRRAGDILFPRGSVSRKRPQLHYPGRKHFHTSLCSLCLGGYPISQEKQPQSHREHRACIDFSGKAA